MNAENQEQDTGPSATAIAAYNQIVADAEIGDIRLVDLKFSAKSDYYKALREEDLGGKKLIRSFDSALSEISYDAENKTLGGKFDWEILATSSKRKLLKMSATFFVIYINVPDVGQDHAQAYMERVGRFATYPYLRALVSQLSWESRTELPMMPVLK